jgi:outer membrane protein
MIRRCIAVLLMSLMAGVLASLYAQAPPPTLTLHQAEQIALNHHPQIFAAQDYALAAGQVTREVRSAYYPTVYGSVTGMEADHDTRIGAGYLSTGLLYSKQAEGVTVDQLIYDSGYTPNLVASSRLNASAQQRNTQATRYDVLLQVDQAYFEVLRAQELVRVAKQTVAERGVVFDQVRAMVNNKLKSDLDETFAKVNLGQAQLLEIRTEDNLQVARAQLTRALGLESAPRYKLMREPLPSKPPSTARHLITIAFANRPEIKSQRDSLQSARKYQRAQRDLSYPSVNMEGDAGYIPAIDQLTLPRVVPNHYDAVAVNLNVPIFNGHLFAADREAAFLRAQAAHQNLRNEEEQIARDVRAAWADAVTGYRRIGVADMILNQAKLSMALAQGRYTLGLSSIVALTQAQLTETSAAIQDVDARYDYQNLMAALRYQEGLLR